jgi:hypothetical protein
MLLICWEKSMTLVGLWLIRARHVEMPVNSQHWPYAGNSATPLNLTVRSRLYDGSAPRLA